MKIYIASSWKNEHGVTMLTALLRADGHEVISWIENNYGENHNHVTKKMDFETWVNSPESDQSFEFDTTGAKTCDLLIYYGPAGKDAGVELGIAYGAGVPIVGLWAKGEDLGLMRKVVRMWFSNIIDLRNTINNRKRNPYEEIQNNTPVRKTYESLPDYKNRLENYYKYEKWAKSFTREPFEEIQLSPKITARNLSNKKI